MNLPPHLIELFAKLDAKQAAIQKTHSTPIFSVKPVVVPGLEWMGEIK